MCEHASHALLALAGKPTTAAASLKENEFIPKHLTHPCIRSLATAKLQAEEAGTQRKGNEGD